jgi:hypothetical protein
LIFSGGRSSIIGPGQVRPIGQKEGNVKTVVLNPETWIRGGVGFPMTLLLRADGKMCCMGFAALAMGVTEDEIMGRSIWGVCANPKLRDSDKGGRLSKLYQINDTDYVANDEERVRHLNAELERLGEDFRFELAKEGA